MPRPRFSWLNLDNSLLEHLGSVLRLKGDPATALEKEYGSTPKADFIRDAWPILLESWLPNDPEACSAVAECLRSKGLGEVEIESQLNYLKSCRNSQNLREACIKIFLDRGKRESAGSEVNKTSSTWKQEKSSNDELPSQEEEDGLRGVVRASRLSGVDSDSNEDTGNSSRGREAFADNASSTYRASEEKSGAADQKAAESLMESPGLDSDRDQLSAEELDLAIALLPSDVREGLVRLGHLDSQGEWVSADRSTEGLKRAISMANQSAAPLEADLPQRTETPKVGTIPMPPSSAPTISNKQHNIKIQDNTIQAEPRRRIRWGMHTGPLIIVGALLAVTISSGLIGFVLLIFFGLPIAFYSFYKDLNEQAKRLGATTIRRSELTLSRSAAETIPSKTQATSSTQGWTEPPCFDYSPRNGKKPDTEEWGKANIQIILNYATDAAIYCLALKATQNGKGKGTRSAEIDVIWSGILLMAAEQDKEMAKCLQIAEKSIKSMVFNKLIQDGLCRELANGELTLAEGIPEAEDVSFANTEYAEMEIDGIVFPLLTELSPDQISYYGADKRAWVENYPTGAENWHKIATHSRLLSQKRVTASQTEAGPWLYTAAINEVQLNSQTEHEQDANAEQPRSVTDQDSALLSMWDLVRPAEAVDLKFIVMDSEGRFAGEFSADDQHGDRYFTITENSKGAWSMGSNLICNDPDTLSKSAKAGLTQYRDICTKATYRYETDSNNIHSNDGVQDMSSTNTDRSQLSSALTGNDLIQRVRELGDVPAQSLAKACGYVTTIQGAEDGDTEAFYNALFHAHSSQK